MSASESADAWTALLAHATQLAQAARAWPEDGAGGRMRASVAPLVQLQAVTIAMDRLEEIARGRRAYARDQADLLVGRACETLRRTWHGEPMPESFLEAMSQARRAISDALYAGLRGLRWPGPGAMVVPDWCGGAQAPGGTLALMEPGTIALEGEIVGWWSDREDLDCPGCECLPLSAPVQIYRRFGPDGRFEGSATVPLHEELPAGMPMLVPLLLAGEPVGSFSREPAAWLALQRAAGIPGS